VKMDIEKLCKNIVNLPEKMPAGLIVSGITTDSRKIMPGMLFAAVRGYETDGHDFIGEAVRKGAAAILTEESTTGFDCPIIKVENIRKTVALLAARIQGNPASKMKIYGVTGTNGKTTFTYLMEALLETAGLKPGVIGTLNYRWPGHHEAAERTTPDAVDLQKYLGRMNADGADRVVMEVSSHALALHRTEGIEFEAVIFTNISRDHLDFHDSMQNYAATKAKLFSSLARQGVGIINEDDAMSGVMKSACKGRFVTYSQENRAADYFIHSLDMSSSGSKYELATDKGEIRVETPLVGRFNVLNTAAALIAGIETGLKEEQVLAGIAELKVIPGRMEQVKCQQKFEVIVDYAHTPAALRNILQTGREFTKNRIILVFGCGGDRDRGKRPEMGLIASELADAVILTDDNPRTENSDRILEDIQKGIKNSENVLVIPDRKEAIEKAISIAAAGDTILIAGKGHENYQIIGKEKTPFDDRIIAEACLNKSGDSIG